MKILSIETSCDDTGITIMEVKGGVTNAEFKVLAHTSNSQIPTHVPYGGVYPMLAKREHAKNLPILLEEALLKSKLKDKKKPADLVMVTYGPGLEMCLWEGITFAKDLGKKWGVPVFPVNHMEGHVLSVFGKSKGKFKIPKAKGPILSLLVSGGHTQLVVSKKWLEYEIIGETVDDAVGEAYDKVARTLGLPYPGGPQISRLAEEYREKLKQSSEGVRSATARDFRASSADESPYPEKIGFNFSLPRPMMHSKNFNFSYSGLKTAVLYLVRDLGGLEKIDEKTKRKIALEFENAAIEPLLYKTAKAIEKYKIKSVFIGGGVACNIHLQREMKKLLGKKVKLYLPPKDLTGDNSLMIGIAGYLQYVKNKKKAPKPETIKAVGTGFLKLK